MGSASIISHSSLGRKPSLFTDFHKNILTTKHFLSLQPLGGFGNSFMGKDHTLSSSNSFSFSLGLCPSVCPSLSPLRNFRRKGKEYEGRGNGPLEEKTRAHGKLVGKSQIPPMEVHGRKPSGTNIFSWNQQREMHDWWLNLIH